MVDQRRRLAFVLVMLEARHIAVAQRIDTIGVSAVVTSAVIRIGGSIACRMIDARPVLVALAIVCVGLRRTPAAVLRHTKEG